jgi:hypothetical protein
VHVHRIADVENDVRGGRGETDVFGGQTVRAWRQQRDDKRAPWSAADRAPQAAGEIDDGNLCIGNEGCGLIECRPPESRRRALRVYAIRQAEHPSQDCSNAQECFLGHPRISDAIAHCDWITGPINIITTILFAGNASIPAAGALGMQRNGPRHLRCCVTASCAIEHAIRLSTQT